MYLLGEEIERKRIREEVRAWQLGCRVDKRIDDLARMFNPIIRGWLTYYGRYYPSALYPTLRYLDGKSRMSREVHVRFRERLGVGFPRALDLLSWSAPIGGSAGFEVRSRGAFSVRAPRRGVHHGYLLRRILSHLLYGPVR